MSLTNPLIPKPNSKTTIEVFAEFATFISVFTLAYTTLALYMFSHGSAQVFQFALRQVNPLHMLIAQVRVFFPALILISWFMGIASVANSEKKDAKYYFKELLPTLIFPIVLLTIPGWYWVAAICIFAVYFYFIWKVRQFRKTGLLPRTLKWLIRARVGILSYRYVIVTFLGIYSLVLAPNGAWMNSEIIRTNSKTVFSAFVEERQQSIIYLDVKSHRLGELDYSEITWRRPCTVLLDIRPLFSSEELISSKYC